MTEKRFTIKPQDDLFGVVDNYSADKVCVINGIRTEIEAEWLCKDMNALNDENEQLKQAYTQLKHRHSLLHDEYLDLEIERDDLKQYKKEVKETLNEAFDKDFSDIKIVVMWIATELGVDLE